MKRTIVMSLLMLLLAFTAFASQDVTAVSDTGQRVTGTNIDQATTPAISIETFATAETVREVYIGNTEAVAGKQDTAVPRIPAPIYAEYTVEVERLFVEPDIVQHRYARFGFKGFGHDHHALADI